MPRLSKRVIFTFVVATLSGACLHFVYALLPNPVTALVSPVNESLWEHLKILFWPGLAAVFFLRGREERAAPRLLALLISGAVMLCVGYVYHILLNGEALGFDVSLYVLVMATAFLLPVCFKKPFSSRLEATVVGLTVLTAAAILIFTFAPPGFLLFIDLSGVHTWVRIPC